jgi:hypothetical protein
VKLNERPIFFRCIFITLAIGQSLWHIYKDEDEIPMPIRKASAIKNKDGTIISAVEPPRNQIRRNLFSITKSATAKALILYGIGFVLYYSILRSVIVKQICMHITNTSTDRMLGISLSVSPATSFFSTDTLLQQASILFSISRSAQYTLRFY